MLCIIIQKQKVNTNEGGNKPMKKVHGLWSIFHAIKQENSILISDWTNIISPTERSEFEMLFFPPTTRYIPEEMIVW